MRIKPSVLRFGVFIVVYYIANCMYQSYMSLYYTAVGFTAAQMGVVNAGVALVSMAAQPLWGTLGDRVRNRAGLIALLALASGALAFAFRWFRAFLPLMLLSCLFSWFYTSVQPMGDSLLLPALDARGLPFGPFRLAGGLSFAVSGVIFGRLLDRPGRALMIPAYLAALCLATAAATFTLPGAEVKAAQRRRLSFSELFKYRELMRLLAFMAPVQITMGYFYTFFSPHFVSLPGGSSGRLGICYFISAMSEVPFLLLSDKLFDRFGAGRLMRLSAVTLAVRWLIVGFARNAGIVMASQALHGWGFIVMTVCMAKYISRAVPEELQASGQMLLAIVSFGISRAVGNLGGGLLAGWMGRQNVFFVCAAVCAVTLLIGGRRVGGKAAKA